MKLLSKIYTKLPVGYITIYSSLNNEYIESIQSALNQVGLGKFRTKVVEPYNDESADTIVARRFNIGNIGKYSVVILTDVRPDIRGVDYSAFHQFATTLLDITSFDTRPEVVINSSNLFNDIFTNTPCGNLESSKFNLNIDSKPEEVCEEEVLDCGASSSEDINADYDSAPIYYSASPQSESKLLPNKSSKGNVFQSFIGRLHNLITSPAPSASKPSKEKDVERTEQEDETAVSSIELDKKMYLDRISAIVLDYVLQFNEMPPIEQIEEILKGKLTIATETLSPIVVNRDLKVILPAYNELEMRFSPILRTIYILFLCHPEGIVLKQISDYRREIDNIYLLIKPGGDDNLMKHSIDDLCDPTSDSFRQKLSKINRIVRNSIVSPNLSESYIITGDRGQPYRIGINSNKITLPQCLK